MRCIANILNLSYVSDRQGRGFTKFSDTWCFRQSRWMILYIVIRCLNTVRVFTVYVVYIYSINSNSIQTPLHLIILVPDFKEVHSTPS